MISNILDMLEIAKQKEDIGEYTHIALGKYKYPDSVKEAYKQFKNELCLLRKQ